MIERMRADLLVARKQRDAVATDVLRATLAAIENSEAPPIDSAPLEVRGQLEQHARVELTEADVARIITAEIDDRDDTIRQFEGGGATDAADELRRQNDVLRRYVGPYDD